MFKYTFTLRHYNDNGEYVTENLTEFHNSTYAFTGFSEVIARIQGELNSGYIELLSDESHNFQIFSILTILVQDGNDSRTLNYYVGRDEVEVSNKHSGKYLHKIELIDLTKKLEKKVLETITFTQPSNINDKQYTIWDCLQRLWRIYESTTPTITSTQVTNWLNGTLDYEDMPNENDNYDKLLDFIDSGLKAKLNSIPAPQLVLSNLTLREAFDEVLKYVNGISKVEFDGIYFTLGCEFFNNTKDLIDFFNKNESHNTGQNVEDYDIDIQNFVKNQITEDFNTQSSLVFPSETTYCPMKAKESDYLISDSNFGMLLENNIYSLQDVFVNCSYNLVIERDGVAVVSLTENNANVNIIDNVVDSEQFGNLDISYEQTYDIDKKLKNNTVYYDYNGNFIYCGYHFKELLFERHSFVYALSIGLAKQLYEQYKTQYTACTYVISIANQGAYSSEDKYVTVSFTVENTGIIHNNQVSFGYLTNKFKFNEQQFRVRYTPIYNARLSTQKDDTTQVKLNTSSLSNQRGKVISLQNVSLNDKSNVERTGNENFEIAIRHKHLSELYNTGDYTTDGYIITKAEYIYYDTYIIGKYEFTKNYTKLSEYIGINSEYRPYEIPSGKEVYERNMVLNDYVYISTNDKTYTHTPHNISTNHIQNYIKTLWNDSTQNSTINNVVVNMDFGALVPRFNEISSGANALYFSCTSDGGGNNLLFHFSFNDNISAGYVEYDNGDGKILMQKAPYTTNGKSCIMALQFINGESNIPTNKIPLINTSSVIYTDKVVSTIDNVYLLKDPSEIIDFTYQISLLNKTPNDILVGRDFTKKNNFVYNNDNEVYYIYGTNTKFQKDDIVIPSSAVQVSALSSNNCSIQTLENGYRYLFQVSGLSGYNYYYIGNKANNTFIMAATSSAFTNGIKFTFSGKRTDIKERY